MANYFDDLADLEDIGSLELGWPWSKKKKKHAAMQRARANQARAYGARPMPANRLIPGTPGVPMPGLRLQPLGFGASAFTAASGTTLTLTATPQRPFKGQRLVVDITRTGATATGLVTISRLDVGTANQMISSQGLGASAFAATAFDVNLQLDPATPGILITIVFNISVAPGAADRVDFSGTMFGTAVG